jgi:hypothetical protein
MISHVILVASHAAFILGSASIAEVAARFRFPRASQVEIHA